MLYRSSFKKIILENFRSSNYALISKSTFRNSMCISFFNYTAFIGTLLLFSVGNSYGEKICRCPVLEVKDVKELYSSGKTYDRYIGYIVHSQKKVMKKDWESITNVKMEHPTFNSDNTCTCNYIIKNKSDWLIDNLGLQKQQIIAKK